MIRKKPYLIPIFVIISAGLIFSGYLSFTKLITGACALNETCPYFLGYPACWYGFGMYFVMFVLAWLALLGKLNTTSLARAILAVSFLGTVFAGRFAIEELRQARIIGALGLSTCAYGLVFYVAIFIFSLIALHKLRNESSV